MPLECGSDWLGELLHHRRALAPSRGYLCYPATLTGSEAATPEFALVMATPLGTNPSTLYSYVMDGVENITGTSAQTAAGRATAARTVNDLSQLTANVVAPVSGEPNCRDRIRMVVLSRAF